MLLLLARTTINLMNVVMYSTKHLLYWRARMAILLINGSFIDGMFQVLIAFKANNSFHSKASKRNKIPRLVFC